MKKKVIFVRISLFLLASMLAAPVFCQTAPQRSEELCATLQESASENGYSFRVTEPGFCAADIDKGYTIIISYNKEDLYVGLIIDVGVLNGDASAFWLRLSAFDNLASLALGTKQQDVFDKANKLALQAAKEILPLVQQGQTNTEKHFNDTAQLALLGAFADTQGHITILAAADTKDIDKMKRDRVLEAIKGGVKLDRKEEKSASGEVAGWRRVLALSLLTFAAGAKGYTNAYQATQQRRPVTCYTNFFGSHAFTSCY
jgi:hypothetical protein